MKNDDSYSPYSTHIIGLDGSTSSNWTTPISQPDSVGYAAAMKRKVDRACDFCRRRKTKCDGSKMPENTCTNCIQNRKACTYNETSRPRGPPKAYVTGLEDRLEQMEALLHRLRPGIDFSDVLGPSVIRDSWKNESPGRKSNSPASGTDGDNHPPRSNYLASSYAAEFSGPEWASSSSSGRAIHRRSSYSHERLSDTQDDKATPEGSNAETGFSSESMSSEFGSSSTSSSFRGKKRLTARGLEPATAGAGATFWTNEGRAAGSIEEATTLISKFRFYGKSSNFRILDQARKLKKMHLDEIGSDDPIPTRRVPMQPERRDEFWTIRQWEQDWLGLDSNLTPLTAALDAAMPPEDLAEKLFSLYFTHVNSQHPLLHRPTFERQWASRQSQDNPWFNCLCLSMCAVASRWSDDERVLCEPTLRTCGKVGGSPEEQKQRRWRTAGWKYHDVLLAYIPLRRSMLRPACLFEVQFYTSRIIIPADNVRLQNFRKLLAMFLRGTSHAPAAWLVVSTGIRQAQDIGAHRKKVYGNKPNAEEELWKRAWWHLVLFDRFGSFSLGRSCCTREEERQDDSFDVDLPLEVDDEYWENPDPNLAFKQPPGKPSLVTAFNSMIKLSQIMAFCIRTLYSIEKSQLLLGFVGPHWRERIMAQLNDALAQWINSVPKHLQWSPNMENRVFASQAATMYTSYYLTYIMVYRPFIPPSTNTTSHTEQSRHGYKPPYPAIELCTDAARSCVRIIEVQLQHGLSNIAGLIASAHMSAASLLMNVWDIKVKQKTDNVIYGDVKPRAEETIDMLLGDVFKLLKVLECVESRWESAGIYLDHLKGSLPTPYNGSIPAQPETSTIDTQSQHPTSYDRTSAQPIALHESRDDSSSIRSLSPPLQLFDSNLGWTPTSRTYPHPSDIGHTTTGRSMEMSYVLDNSRSFSRGPEEATSEGRPPSQPLPPPSSIMLERPVPSIRQMPRIPNISRLTHHNGSYTDQSLHSDYAIHSSTHFGPDVQYRPLNQVTATSVVSTQGQDRLTTFMRCGYRWNDVDGPHSSQITEHNPTTQGMRYLCRSDTC